MKREANRNEYTTPRRHAIQIFDECMEAVTLMKRRKSKCKQQISRVMSNNQSVTRELTHFVPYWFMNEYINFFTTMTGIELFILIGGCYALYTVGMASYNYYRASNKREICQNYDKPSRNKVGLF